MEFKEIQKKFTRDKNNIEKDFYASKTTIALNAYNSGYSGSQYNWLMQMKNHTYTKKHKK